MKAIYIDSENIVIGIVIYSPDGSPSFAKPYKQQINVENNTPVQLGYVAIQQENGTWTFNQIT